MGFTQRFKGKVAMDALVASAGQTNQQGSGTGVMKSSGLAYSNAVPVGCSATTNLQTLMSTSLPANSMNANGRGLMVTTWGTFGANAQNKSLKLVIGGASLSSGSSTQNGVSWQMQGIYVRQGAAVQQALLEGQMGTTFIAPSAVGDTASDTAAITISQQATSGSGSQSDIIQTGMIVEFFNY